MTISDRIFEILKQKGMSQKEFSEQTGIAQSSISDWKRKRTNPSSDCILAICKTLGVTPGELLSGTRIEGDKRTPVDYYVVTSDSSEGYLLESYQGLNAQDRGRLEGYLQLLLEQSKRNP